MFWVELEFIKGFPLDLFSNVFGGLWHNWAWRPVFWGCSHCDNTPDREYSLNWGGESLLNVTTSFNMHQYGTLAVRDNSDGCYHNCAGRAAARRIFEQLDHQIQGEKMKTEVERFLLGQEANSQQCWRHLSIRHCHSGLPPPKKISWERYYYCTQYYRTLSDRCYCRLNCIWTAQWWADFRAYRPTNAREKLKKRGFVRVICLLSTAGTIHWLSVIDSAFPLVLVGPLSNKIQIAFQSYGLEPSP